MRLAIHCAPNGDRLGLVLDGGLTSLADHLTDALLTLRVVDQIRAPDRAQPEHPASGE